MRRVFIVGLKQYCAYLVPASCSTARTTLHRAAQRHISLPSAARTGLGLHVPWFWGQSPLACGDRGRSLLAGVPILTAVGRCLGCFSGQSELHPGIKS